MTVEKSFSVKNYSMEANYLALENLVEKNPELWSDKYLLGTGAQLLRVIAAGQSANGVRTLQALYESLIGYMQRRDSMLGYGETMGYSAFRGSNDELTIIATASETISIPARTVIGKVQDVDLVCSEAIVASKGTTFSFKAKVGNLKTESRQIVNAEYKFIRFLSKNISDDVVLLINDEPVPYVTAFKDAYNVENDTAYVLLTNAYESVDAFIVDKTGQQETDTSLIYTISYLEYTDIDYVEFDIVFNYGDIQSVSVAKAGEQPQSIENLRVTIPYFRDTQREVIANRDPIKVLQLLLPTVESTSGTNLNTVHSLLTYKYEDYHLVPDTQLKDLEKQLAPTYYFGFCPSNIVHPIQYRTNLDVEIVVFSSLVNEVSIIDYLNSILKSYEKLPEASSIEQGDSVDTISYSATINLDDIESELNKMKDAAGDNVIKTAYVTIHSETMTTNTQIFLGNVYEENDTLYQISRFRYQSGVVPNTFTWINAKGTTDELEGELQYAICGDILLEKWRLIYGAKEIESNTWYSPDTIVKKTDTEMYRIHPYYTLPTIQPIWNTDLGSLTYSGDLIWLTIKYVVGTGYHAGDLAIKGMIVTPSGSDVSYQLIGFSKTLNTLDTPELITNELGAKGTVRSINNIWQSYTILSVDNEDLIIHV